MQHEKGWHRFRFFLGTLRDLLLPAWIRRRERKRLFERFRQLDPGTKEALEIRVAYYNQLSSPFDPGADAKSNRTFTRRGQPSAYYLDLKRLIRCFPPDVRFQHAFGDVTWVPDAPAFVKSRPIAPPGDNANSVLLKLDSARHYFMVRDRRAFRDKTPRAIWRGKGSQPHRREFLRRFHDSPVCDVGCVHPDSRGEPWHGDFVPPHEQLNYRYVVSIEGNDVATNLKWIMASNSLCLMRRPRFETWFMEGALQSGVHYVQLADDHSDLEEKVRYYNAYPDEAEAIIRNAQAHVAQFLDREQELLVSLLVMDRYFSLACAASESVEGAPR